MPLGKVWRRLTASNADLVKNDLAKTAASSGASTVQQCRVRSRVTVQGVVTMVTLNPRGAKRWLEVDLDDGTGVVTLIWMGRRAIPGIDPGRTLRVEGRLALDNGRRVIYNPQYQLIG